MENIKVIPRGARFVPDDMECALLVEQELLVVGFLGTVRNGNDGDGGGNGGGRGGWSVRRRDARRKDEEQENDRKQSDGKNFEQSFHVE